MSYTGPGSPNAPADGIVATSTPVTVTLGGPAVALPYPTSAPQSLSWCVVSNSSPFTVVVSQGQVLGQIAAFTADLYPVRTGAPLGIQAVAGAGLISPGTDSTVYATWYQQLPSGTYPAALGSGAAPFFATDTIQAQTTTTTIAAVKFGPFDVSQFAGMRFSMVVEPLFSDCLVDLRWYDTAAIAAAPGLFDFAGVFDFRVRQSDSASFIIPHQADFLVVTLTSADAGQTKPHWSAANRQQGFDINGQGLGSGSQNVNVNGGAVGVIGAPPSQGPNYRIRAVTARATAATAAGVVATIGLSDDGGVSILSTIETYRFAGGLVSESMPPLTCDITIGGGTSLILSNGTAVPIRCGATWEVVPPMFKFPRDA